jgi:hypothetical protein
MVIYSIYGSLPLTLSMNGCTEKEVQILCTIQYLSFSSVMRRHMHEYGFVI